MATTCRELAQLNSPELAAREKSHRDPLKQREKQLRNSTDVDELFQLLEDCEYELAEDDSLLKKARQLFASKETQVLAHVQTRLETKKTQTCRFLQNLLNQVSRATSSGALSLTKKIKASLEERMKTHRRPLETALGECERLKDLAKLKQKMANELAPADELFTRLAGMEQSRKHVRDELTTKYKSLVLAKKWKLSQISSFLKEVLEELDEDDPLVGQVKSLMENKMQQDRGLKPVREIERLPDEEAQVLSKRSGGSKKKTSSSAVSTSSSSSSRAPPAFRDASGSLFGNVQSLAKGLTSDLTGAPTQSSTLYKLGILICFLLYIAIVSYSASLTIKVAKVDLPDLSVASTQVLQKLRLRKAPSPLVLDPNMLAAVAAAGNEGGGDSSSPQPPPEKDEEEEKGGGDDDEED